VLQNKDYKFIVPAIFHDIGKPFSAYQKPEDILTKEYSFTDHEEVSYQIIKNWFFLSDWTKDIVRYHYIIRDIKKCKQKNDLVSLKEKEAIFNTFSDEFVKELEVFLIYDDCGKGI
jgi:CRISPR/Cas system-associated endonuclease Cas3-HD